MEFRYYLIILALVFICYLLTTKKLVEIKDKGEPKDNLTYKVLKVTRIITITIIMLAMIYFVGHSIIGLIKG